MFKIPVLLVSAICSFIILGPAAGDVWGGDPPQVVARMVVQKFMNGDSSVKEHITGNQAAQFLEQVALMAENREAAGGQWKVDLSGLTFEVVTIDGDEALVRMTGQMTVNMPKGPKTTQEDQVWKLRRIGGQWKVTIN